MSSAKGSAVSYVTGEKIKGDWALWFEQAPGMAPFWEHNGRSLWRVISWLHSWN